MAPKSLLFTEGSLKFENKEHLFDFVFTLYFYDFALMLYIAAKCHCQLWEWKIISKIVRISGDCDQNGDRVS